MLSLEGPTFKKKIIIIIDKIRVTIKIKDFKATS